jgi:hypothetical protein
MLLRGSLLVCMGMLLAGCAGTPRPDLTVERLAAEAPAARQRERAIVESVVGTLAERAALRNDRTLDVLLLSGGGQNGAYGIGFLRGWRERGDASALPRFDLVGGISTGALQSPYALIGTPRALDQARTLYLGSATEFAPTFDWLFWLRRSGGAVNTEKFDRAVADAVNAELRRDLRAAFDEKRQLVVGTVDYDLGVGRLWNLGSELAETPTAIARTNQILLAATAIPGVFPPQMIDGHVHGDGGVVSDVLPMLDLDSYRRLAVRLRERGLATPGREVTLRLWVVMNFWTHPALAVIDPGSRSAIAQRGNRLIFGLTHPLLVQRLDAIAQAVDSGVPGLRMQMRWTAIPSELANEPGAQQLFDAAWMARLESLGYARARSAEPWAGTVASPYERPAPTPAP